MFIKRCCHFVAQIRILVTYLTVFGARLNVKERIFVAIAWIPKATVQVTYQLRDFSVI